MKQEISNLFREIAGFQLARWSLRILKSADAAAAATNGRPQKDA